MGLQLNCDLAILVRIYSLLKNFIELEDLKLSFQINKLQKLQMSLMGVVHSDQINKNQKHLCFYFNLELVHFFQTNRLQMNLCFLKA